MNRRMSKGGFAVLNHFIEQIEFIPSIFDICPPLEDSKFDICGYKPLNL